MPWPDMRQWLENVLYPDSPEWSALESTTLVEEDLCPTTTALDDMSQWPEDVPRLGNVLWSGTLEFRHVRNEDGVLPNIGNMQAPPGIYTRSQVTLEADKQSGLK
ncbi:hypothetical protein LTR40_006086 [Exophiala xenobiotica]|nr:hypothetical protein LTR40_006086 [Exophiala xenobiotica]